MPGPFGLVLTPSEQVTVGLAALLVVLLAIMSFRAWKNSRVSPEERERRRRASLAASGRMGAATLVEVREGLLFYSYDVRGVEYTASQDVSRLLSLVPEDLAALGPVGVKYDPRNPANSIILAEQWSGIRR